MKLQLDGHDRCLEADGLEAGRSAHGSRASQAKSIYLETFGCQMNELDSELVRGSLSALGYRFTGDPASASIILYNTCSVREQAENKVWSRVGLMGLRKKEGARFILGVIGCMAEREGPSMMRRFPQIDLLCGPGELDKLPMLLDNALNEKLCQAQFSGRIALQGANSRRSSTLAAAEDNLELLDLSRAFDPDRSTAGGGNRRSAYVRITRGCNKFCTYCVVPYTRGAEVHRPPQSIVDECKMLADRGVIEVTLLGQTVNHYVYTHGAAVSVGGAELPQVGPAFKNGSGKPRHRDAAALARTTTFADLLQRIHDQVPAIQRLRFVTSFPRDFGDDILHVMAACPRICRYLHVPAQSGSNRILKLMNRGYTAEQYLEFIERARSILDPAPAPDLPAARSGVEIAGDFIVGFPTETDEDFEGTMELLRAARYKNSFIFKYSPRPGTVAIDRFEDDVPEHVKRRRNRELLDLQSQISAQVHAAYLGRTVEVFVEQARPVADDEEAGRATSQAQIGHTTLTIGGAKPHAPAAARSARSDPHAPPVQLSGRTGGDLIAVFELRGGWAHRADDLVGTIVPVRIESAGSLILRGRLARDIARGAQASQPRRISIACPPLSASARAG